MSSNNNKPEEYQRFEDAARQIFSVPVQVVKEQMQSKNEPEDSSDAPEPSESDS